MNQDGMDAKRFAKLIGITAVAWELDGEAAERCLEHFTSGGRIVTNVRSWNDRRRSMSGTERRQSWRPSCACPEKWIDHMKISGFSVTTVTVNNVAPHKTRLGVPVNLGFCHTAEVGG